MGENDAYDMNAGDSIIIERSQVLLGTQTRLLFGTQTRSWARYLPRCTSGGQASPLAHGKRVLANDVPDFGT